MWNAQSNTVSYTGVKEGMKRIEKDKVTGGGGEGRTTSWRLLLNIPLYFSSISSIFRLLVQPVCLQFSKMVFTRHFLHVYRC